MASNDLTDQAELALARRPQQADVPAELVWRQKSGAAAFTLACSASSLDDKEIYLALEIDAGYFSRIKKGEATLQADLIGKFCTIAGNTIYAQWIAYQVGCALVVLKSEAERRAEAAEARALDAERKLAFATELLRGRAA